MMETTYCLRTSLYFWGAQTRCLEKQNDIYSSHTRSKNVRNCSKLNISLNSPDMFTRLQKKGGSLLRRPNHVVLVVLAVLVVLVVLFVLFFKMA